MTDKEMVLNTNVQRQTWETCQRFLRRLDNQAALTVGDCPLIVATLTQAAMTRAIDSTMEQIYDCLVGRLSAR
jgi:hypothetical protein